MSHERRGQQERLAAAARDFRAACGSSVSPPDRDENLNGNDEGRRLTASATASIPKQQHTRAPRKAQRGVKRRIEASHSCKRIGLEKHKLTNAQ